MEIKVKCTGGKPGNKLFGTSEGQKIKKMGGKMGRSS